MEQMRDAQKWSGGPNALVEGRDMAKTKVVDTL